MVDERQVIIYPIKVKGEERKTIDISSLNNWMDHKILEANPFLLDTREINTLGEFRAMVFENIYLELDKILKKELGLHKKPEEPEKKDEVQEISAPIEPELVDDGKDDVVSLED